MRKNGVMKIGVCCVKVADTQEAKAADREKMREAIKRRYMKRIL